MSKLLDSFNLPGFALTNRIVMAPMTRARAPLDVADENTALYYAQRATAGLIISEGTPISPEGQGYLFNPGIFNKQQIEGWRLSTNSVHSVGGRIFAQLWHVGRVSHPSIKGEGKLPVSASSMQARGAAAYGYDETGKPSLVLPPAPRQLTTNEVSAVVLQFADAAANAVAAGFDGVEIHGANGYLHEQFLNPLVNDRDDRYSSARLPNRLRFTIEVIDAIISRIGAHRTGIRFSPYGQLFDMPLYPEIDETYLALAEAINERNLAYVHLMNQTGFERVGNLSESGGGDNFESLLKSMRSKLPNVAMILAGGLTQQLADKMIEEDLIDLAAFGKPFISNPDLVNRMRQQWPLAPSDRDTYYGGGQKGYIDYPPYQST